jgi:hypothetical protein
MSAATRTTPATPDLRRASAALGVLALAATLVVAVGFSQASSTKSQAAPVAAPAPAVHDHGWSTAGTSGSGQELIIRGSNGGGLNYTGIPYPAPGSGQELIIRGSNGGGLNYTGIPYPAPAGRSAGGANRTRLAQ